MKKEGLKYPVSPVEQAGSAVAAGTPGTPVGASVTLPETELEVIPEDDCRTCLMQLIELLPEVCEGGNMSQMYAVLTIEMPEDRAGVEVLMTQLKRGSDVLSALHTRTAEYLFRMR